MPTHAIGTRLISLTQIHPNPEQIRREFDPAGLEELKNSIRERGLISPIAVWQRGESDFVIIAGERRFRGVSSLGWKEVDCRIWPAGTPPEEVELLSLVENIQRRDLNPIEVAGGYRVLSRPPYGLSHEKIAEEVGVDKSVVTRTIALLDEPPEIQALVARATISPAHCRYIQQIGDLTKRIAFARQVAQEGWNVKETEKRVNRLPGKAGKAPSRQVSRSTSSGDGDQPPDPLADFWPQVKASPALMELMGQWGVSYGQQALGPVAKGKAIVLPAWKFWMLSNTPTPKAALKKWFLAMAEAMGDTGQEERRAQKVSGAMVPSTEAEMEQALEDQKNARLPKSPKEWVEVEALASQGPAAIYAWVYGKNSLMARKAKPLTWEDLGEKDPIAGCHTLIEAQEMMLEDRDKP